MAVGWQFWVHREGKREGARGRVRERELGAWKKRELGAGKERELGGGSGEGARGVGNREVARVRGIRLSSKEHPPLE